MPALSGEEAYAHCEISELRLSMTIISWPSADRWRRFAERGAGKLNASEGRTALTLAAEGSKRQRRWLPQVRVRFPNPGVV
jgi:hypothetical protein